MSPPTIDGVVIPGHPWRLAKEGKHANVSIVAGTTTEDVAEQWVSCTNCTEADTKAFLQDMMLPALGYPADEATVSGLLNLYRPTAVASAAKTNYTPWYWAQLHMQVDAMMTCAARRACQMFANQSIPAYWYQFARVPQDSWAGGGSYHGAELPYVFKYKPSLTTPADVRLADVVAGLWREVASGDVHSWPRYNEHKREALLLGPGDAAQTVEGLRGPQCDRWDELFNAHSIGPASASKLTIVV